MRVALFVGLLLVIRCLFFPGVEIDPHIAELEGVEPQIILDFLGNVVARQTAVRR
jgi:hypothetical protein